MHVDENLLVMLASVAASAVGNAETAAHGVHVIVLVVDVGEPGDMVKMVPACATLPREDVRKILLAAQAPAEIRTAGSASRN